MLRFGIVARLRTTNPRVGRPVHSVDVSGARDQLRFLDAVGAFGPREAPALALRERLRSIVANSNAVREWDSNGTNFGFNPQLGHTAGEFGHNDFYPVAIAAAQQQGSSAATLYRRLQAAERQLTIEARARLYADADRVLLRDQPVIPLYRGVSNRLVSPRVGGWVDHPGHAHPTRFLTLSA